MDRLVELLEVLESGKRVEVGCFYDLVYPENVYEWVVEFWYDVLVADRREPSGFCPDRKGITFYDDKRELFRDCPGCTHNCVVMDQKLRESLIRDIREELKRQ